MLSKLTAKTPVFPKIRLFYGKNMQSRKALQILVFCNGLQKLRNGVCRKYVVLAS